MVEKVDAQGRSRILEPSGDVPVLRRGLEVVGWMVVRDDDGARSIGDGVGENLPGMDDSLTCKVVYDTVDSL